tara:strand:+ start:175 stop:777 length:603 start_codon:yes stop_codon:yes gene_type:complete
MQSQALEKVSSRYRVAERAIGDMSKAASPDDFADAWFVFLTAWKGIYTILEQGAKSNAQSRQWFGAKKLQRKRNPVADYLFHARNAEEHGLERATASTLGQLIVDVPDVGKPSREISYSYNPGTGELKISRQDGGPLEFHAAYGAGYALRPVEIRGGKLIAPPYEYEGDALEDVSPLAIAKIGMRIIRTVIEEAQDLHIS